MLLGFSTSFMHNFIQPISKEAIRICREIGCKAVELGAGRLERLPYFSDISADDLKDFQYISVHGPNHNEMKKLDTKGQRAVLDNLQEIHERLPFACLVLHPGEWITDWEIFKDYSLPIAFENMDWRHKIGTDVASLREIFSNKNFKMVLDVNHSYTHDSTLRLSHDLYDNFKDRIMHCHLSGFGAHESGKEHIPLFQSQQVEIIKAIPNLDLPIIIESICNNKKEVKQEFEYIKKILGLRRK